MKNTGCRWTNDSYLISMIDFELGEGKEVRRLRVRTVVRMERMIEGGKHGVQMDK